jgi:predicted MFS family arabinose efflux permease
VLAMLPDLAVASSLLLLLTLIYMAYAFQDVVSDGLMVETGQSLNMTGQFQSIQWAAVYIAMIIASFAGGFIAELAQKGALSYKSIFGMTAVFPALTALIVLFLVRERPSAHLEQAAKRGLREIFFHKDIWILASFLFLWNFSPSFGAPFFYYTVDTLKFTPSFLGILQAVTSGGGLLGSVLFGLVFARFSMRKFLMIAIALGVFATLSYFVYFVPWMLAHPVFLKVFALTMNCFLGIASAMIFLALLNLAARTSPQFAGGTVFALLMSFYNMGQMGSSALGGYLFPRIGLQPLILISAVFSLFVIFLIPHLPAGAVRPEQAPSQEEV